MARALTLITLVVATLALLVSGWTAWNLHRSQSPQRVIEARGLIIHDASGQPRVILGAPVPDPLSQGRPQGPRATALSGVILLGPDGSERGGYGTSDRGGEALLTLDDATGTTEVFKVVANPDRGASLMVKHQNNTGAMLSSCRASRSWCSSTTAASPTTCAPAPAPRPEHAQRITAARSSANRRCCGGPSAAQVMRSPCAGADTAKTSPPRTCQPRAASASTCGVLSAGSGSHRFKPSIGMGVGSPRACNSACRPCSRCW